METACCMACVAAPTSGLAHDPRLHSERALTRRDGNTSEGSLVPARLTNDNYQADTKVLRKQQRSAYEAWKANQEWEQEQSEELPDIDYDEEILPGLKHVWIRQVAEATL